MQKNYHENFSGPPPFRLGKIKGPLFAMKMIKNDPIEKHVECNFYWKIYRIFSGPPTKWQNF